MQEYPIQYQLSLFPKKPFFPDNNDWAKLQSSIIDQVPFFNGTNINLTTASSNEDLPVDFFKIYLSSEDGKNLIQISPVKFSIIYSLNGELNYKLEDVKFYLASLMKLMMIEVNRWARVGLFYSFFIEKENASNYLLTNFLKKPNKNWSALTIQFNNKNIYNSFGINELVKTGTGGLNLKNDVVKTGINATLDINNVPNDELVLNNEQVEDLFEHLFSDLTIEKYFQLTNLPSDAEERKKEQK